MKISESDWAVFLEHAGATLAKLQVPAQECEHVVGFVLSIKDERVDP